MLLAVLAAAAIVAGGLFWQLNRQTSPPQAAGVSPPNPTPAAGAPQPPAPSPP